MKVLWICNVMLPVIAKALGQEASNKEGWLSGLCDEILERQLENQIELHIAYPTNEKQRGYFDVVETEAGILYAHGFYEDTAHAEKYEPELEERLLRLINSINPDVIHCFGTEFAHTLAVARCCPYPERILVGMQGLCGEIAKAYTADLPEKVLERKTFRDWLKHDGIKEQQQKFVLRGEREKEIIRRVGNVTGRTEFDRSYVRSLHEDARYYRMNETLRPCFYTGEWSMEACEPHVIFISQGDYPLKGLHYLLLAAGRLKGKYPDLQVRIAGQDITRFATMEDKIKISGYGKYLRELMKANQLEECVHFLGKLTDREMKEQYLQCSVYVCCSTNENSPNSLGEAMLLGVPCVAARVGGIESLFEDGKDGILYDGYGLYQSKYNNTCDENAENLYRAIEAMWENPKQMEEYGKNARNHARITHDKEKNYEKMVEIYADMLCI